MEEITERRFRERDILRISAQLPDRDSFEIAQNQLLRWAKNRAGTLPDSAWAGQDFEALAGGPTCMATNFRKGDTLLWGLRVDDPDKSVPGRKWITEVVIGGKHDAAPLFGLRLTVSSPESAADIVPHVPGFMQQIIKRPGLLRNDRPLSLYTVIEDDAGVDSLVIDLEDPKRRVPLFVISQKQGDEPPLVDRSVLGRATLGIGRVYVLSNTGSWVLTQRYGKQLSVFDGAARIYDPGFDEAADPYRHKLFLADRLREDAERQEATNWMCRHAARTSLQQIRLNKDVISFIDLRRARLEEDREELRARGADSVDQLDAARKEIATYREQVEDLNEQLRYFAEEHEEAEERALAAEERLQGANNQIRVLEGKLSQAGKEPLADVELPTSWDQFVDWCDATLASRLRLLPSARRGVRKPKFRDVEQAARCLLWLAREARDSKRGLTSLDLRDTSIESGIQNSPCGKDSYDVRDGLNTYRVISHVKNGGNTRKPEQCLRIYWFWDSVTQEIVIADMPAHRVTGAS